MMKTGKLRQTAGRFGRSAYARISGRDEVALLALGTLLSNQQASMDSTRIQDYEFRIFSQFGDDGIIQYLIRHVDIASDVFIEFGVGNYMESNTRFLMMNNNWSGFVMDCSERAIRSLRNRIWFWKYDLDHRVAFIDKDNIDALMEATGFADIGLLHIDLDGNDYHIFEHMDLSKLNPSIVILEYNSIFGNDRPISIPYDKNFSRTQAHFSNLYFGASLPALHHAACRKGYAFIGSNRAGNNAYFVREDLLNSKIREISIKEGFVESKFRESRDRNYELSYLAGKERLQAIRGLPVVNVETQELEKL